MYIYSTYTGFVFINTSLCELFKFLESRRVAIALVRVWCKIMNSFYWLLLLILKSDSRRFGAEQEELCWTLFPSPYFFQQSLNKNKLKKLGELTHSFGIVFMRAVLRAKIERLMTSTISLLFIDMKAFLLLSSFHLGQAASYT